MGINIITMKWRTHLSLAKDAPQCWESTASPRRRGGRNSRSRWPAPSLRAPRRLTHDLDAPDRALMEPEPRSNQRLRAYFRPVRIPNFLDRVDHVSLRHSAAWLGFICRHRDG